MKEAILIIEDDNDISQMLEDLLEQHGYQAAQAYSGTEALLLLKERVPEAVILDLMLPGMAGEEVLKEIKEQYPQVGVIVSSAKDSVNTRVSLLRAGADDYMVKPFLPKELLFRVNAILRRSYKAENPLVKLAASEIDFDRAEVIRGGEHLSLTAKEHDILAALYRNAGRIVTIDALCEAAWGDNPFGYENSLMAHIRRIREKIEASPSHPASLITIKGLGYKLMVEGK